SANAPASEAIFSANNCLDKIGFSVSIIFVLPLLLHKFFMGRLAVKYAAPHGSYRRVEKEWSTIKPRHHSQQHVS
ncbi:MAG: hypothetical protein ACI8UP_004191, partial [Porticoccaceae bacterium]